MQKERRTVLAYFVTTSYHKTVSNKSHYAKTVTGEGPQREAKTTDPEPEGNQASSQAL
jgi:hypothetical protein